MLKKAHISSLLIALCIATFSQNAPVSTTTTVLPPFSIHMFENLRSDRDKFIVTVTLRDLTQTEGQVRLRLRMESFTHAMQTRRGAATPVHTLIPGVPLRLTNEDLRVYFLEQNLEFTNMPRNLYRNNATVPEGHYRIWFEVYEARTGAHVSRGSEVAAHLHIVQHDVPLINLPQQNATIHLPESGLQHVVFQWAPRHFGPGMLTEYRLQIVEVPPGMNPEQVMHATLVPFFETTTMATSFVFNHTHPPMRLGFTYAFRVQARLRGPDEGMSMFNNNGFTPTQWFTFSQRCPELRNVRVEPINQFAVWVHYMDHPLYERVRIRRRLDQEGSLWRYVVGNQNPLLVPELRPEQGYQYQMMAHCAFEYSNWTPVRTFTIPPAPPPAFTCGAATDPMVIENQNPLQNLRVGDIVRRGRDGWEFRISEVTRSLGNGVFYGYGHSRAPWLGDVWIFMRFENVQFNELYQMMSDQGFFVTVFDPYERGILDLGGRRQEEEPPTADTITIEVPFIIADNTDITITDSDGNPITENSQPPFTITITNPDGEDQQITVPTLPAVITDGSGAEFVVNPDGTVERKTIEEERPGALAEVYHQFYIQINDNTTKHRSNYFAYLLASDRENILRISTSIPNIQFDVEDAFWTVNCVEQEIEELKIFSAEAKTLYVSVLFSYTIRIDADSEPAFRSGRIDSLRITFFEGGLVLFAKADSNTGDFGFDDAQLRQLQAGTTYRTEQIGGITYYVPWMSIRPNAPPANIRIRPQEMNFGFPQEAISEMEIELVSVDSLGDPSDFIRINGSNIMQLPVSQIDRNIGITVPRLGRGYIVAYAVQGDSRERVGKLEVEAREFTRRPYRIVFVKKDSEDEFPTISKENINNFLNNYAFNQIFFGWDLNRDTDIYKMSLTTITAQDSMGLMMDIIAEYFERTSTAILENEFYYVFIATDAVRKNITTANGLAFTGGNVSIVFNESLITTTHELGHNLGFGHIFDDYPIARRTTRNFMDWPRYPDVRRFFHKFQRNILHP